MRTVLRKSFEAERINSTTKAEYSRQTVNRHAYMHMSLICDHVMTFHICWWGDEGEALLKGVLSEVDYKARGLVPQKYNIAAIDNEIIHRFHNSLYPGNHIATMGRISQVFTASLAVLSTATASAVLDLIPSNFDDIVLKSGKPALVEFFAPWCGHCKNLAPVYEELAGNFEFAKDKVTIAKVDADAEKDLGQRFGIQGFPTLKWFDGKSDKPEDYNSGRDLESLTSFITEKTGVKSKAKKAAPSAVEMLTDTTFKEQIGGDKDALVAFTAPWCGRECIDSTCQS